MRDFAWIERMNAVLTDLADMVAKMRADFAVYTLTAMAHRAGSAAVGESDGRPIKIAIGEHLLDSQDSTLPRKRKK